MNTKLKDNGKVPALALAIFSPFIRLAVCMNTTKRLEDDVGSNRDTKELTTEEIVSYNVRGSESETSQ
jgi:hypothetical protein